MVLALVLNFSLPSAGYAKVSSTPSTIVIDLSEKSGRFGDYRFSALGGRKTHPTPKGSYPVVVKRRDFYSRRYKADMPYSVFFTEQAAIHAGSLNTLSHGCIHVSYPTAAYLYKNAQPGKTRVVIKP